METKRKKDSELGNFLLSIILKSGLSHELIAEKIGVSPRSIGYYCTGERKPSQKNLLRILRVTEADLKDIPF